MKTSSDMALVGPLIRCEEDPKIDATTVTTIAEYTPNHIKKCIVGSGHAGKDQVQAMVRRLLPQSRVEQADAADALATAIAHAHLSSTRARIAAALA